MPSRLSPIRERRSTIGISMGGIGVSARPLNLQPELEEVRTMPRNFATTVNHWTDSACARAFWGQQELPPYRQLLTDTSAWLNPRSGERWLDLGCGCGKLTEALWRKSRG